MINLSKDQRSQYGSQFEADQSEGPGIIGKLQIIIVTIFIFNLNICIPNCCLVIEVSDELGTKVNGIFLNGNLTKFI